MIQALQKILPDILTAFGDTFLMVSLSTLFSILAGIPLGLGLYMTSQDDFKRRPVFYAVAGLIANIIRSLPFVILLAALLPFTALITGTTIGPLAATVPLTIAAIPFYARLVEAALKEIPRGVIEAAVAAGATTSQIIFKVLLVEARPGLVRALTVTIISLLGFSAMAGIVGGGGIGDLAIRYGYYRFDDTVMYTTTAFLIILVQLIQSAGNTIARRIDKR
jgi:D-methionine transport system permease protein